MNSSSETSSDPTGLNFSEDEKMALRGLVEEKIKHTDMASSMSVGSLFNNLELSPLPHLPYSQTNILAWNAWLHKQKELSIEKVRSNATKMPMVYQDAFREFLKKLVILGFLTKTTETIENVHTHIIDIIDEK